MSTRRSRRFAARLALAAMLAWLAMPAHAKLMRVAAEGPRVDLCVAGKVVPGAPAKQNPAHACDACCAPQSPAPPAERAAPAAARPAAPKLSAIDLLPMPSGSLRSGLARGPPILL